MIKVGKIYRDNGGKTVLVFGRTTGYGVGVNLTTCKVDEVEDDVFTSEVVFFGELDEQQTENFGFFYPILRAMLKKGSLVAISGKARSGKDTLAIKLVGKLGFKQTALGDPIKRIHNVIYGNSDKKERAGLIMIGQGMRQQDPNVWIKTWLRLAIDDFKYSLESQLVVSDVRQPNEFSFFKSMGALTVRIDANEEKRREILVKNDGENALDEKLLNDETESHVFNADLLIFNEYDETYQEEMDKVLERLTDEG